MHTLQGLTQRHQMPSFDIVGILMEKRHIQCLKHFHHNQFLLRFNNKLKCRWFSFDCKDKTVGTNLMVILYVLKHTEVHC
jgi:hypothetical protein